MLKKKNNTTDLDLSIFRTRVAKEIQLGAGETLETLEKFLIQWWCRHYKRPYKDPLIQTYTLEELIFEFFDVQLRDNPEQLNEALGIEEELEKTDEEDEGWLKDMMGSGYASKGDQEKALGKSDGLKQKIGPLKEFEDGPEEEFDATFDENEF
jgi:hypothetical protein